jgi:plastocyanin
MIEHVIRRWTVTLLIATCTLFARCSEVTASVQIGHATSHQASLANVVVWLTPIGTPTSTPIPKTNAKLTQKDKQFLPHLLVVPTGTSVEFPNVDPFFHNVFSLFNGKRFDLGLYEAGSRRSVTFDREGVSYIFCNIHPQMGAVVVSLNSPWFTISDAAGSVVIRDVPPGRYRLNIWAEQLTLSSSTRNGEVIDVPNERYELGNLEFRQTNTPMGHHKNKFGEEYKPEIRPDY